MSGLKVNTSHDGSPEAAEFARCIPSARNVQYFDPREEKVAVEKIQPEQADNQSEAKPK